MCTVSINFQGYELVEKLVKTRMEDGDLSVHETILEIQTDFDRMGPYHFAKCEGLLVNGSGEEFAVQFMSFFNDYNGSQVY